MQLAAVNDTTEVSEEASASLALHQKNMAFFEEKVPQIFKRLKNLTPKRELVWQADGDVNVRFPDGHLMYEHGAKVDSERQVKGSIRMPARLVFSRPAVVGEDAGKTQAAPVAGGPIDALEEPVTESAAKAETAEPEEDVLSKEQSAASLALAAAETAEEEKEYDFLTQKYDDKASDDHYGAFIRAASRVIHEKNVSIGSKPVVDEPYYCVVFGVGIGYHIYPMVEHYKPAMLILCEDDVEYYYLSTFTFDWRAFYDDMESRKCKVKLAVDGDAGNLVAMIGGFIQTESLLGLDGCISLLHNPSSVLKLAFSEFQSPKTANLASFVGYIVDEYNMMKNSFRNLRSGDKRLLNVVRKTAEAPALIVGSGPSLEDNIDFVKENQDRFIIITSGSSAAVLLRNGIKPDFHANLERARSIYERHVEVVEEGYSFEDIYAVMTTTIWPKIDEFFKGTVYFIRPALSPLAVFCDNDAQILYNEGPQVANTAFAWAKKLGFKEIYLLGVDLGTVDPKRPRATAAWKPQRPRYLTIPVRGNLGRTVFTDQQLIQQRSTLESQIKKLKEGAVYNLGSGVRINGAKPRRTQDVTLPELGFDKREHVKTLFEQFPVYSREKFIADWNSAQVRESVANLTRGMVKTLNRSPEWTHGLIKTLEELNAYVNKALRSQYAPRLLRGSVLRILMHMNALILRVQERDRVKEVYEGLREVLVEQLQDLELEGYALADELESEDEAFAVIYD